MRNAAVGSTVLALALAIPSVAHAQQAQQAGPAAECPPGSWFCAQTGAQPAAPAGQPVPLQPLPGTQAAQPSVTIVQGSALPPPVVIYQPPPPVVVYQAREAPPPPPLYHYRPRPQYPRRNEWGLNLHLEGAMFGSGNNHDAGMGGMGFGLRYKPVPAFGLEANVDFLSGRDYNGFHRDETAFTVNGLIFLNPRSRSQVYLLAGFGWSSARAVNDNFGNASTDFASASNYSYFGGQAGIGLEFRVAKHFALNADIRGFIRGRTDDNAQYNPEFVNPSTGETSNTSAGALVTGGMTFYF